MLQVQVICTFIDATKAFDKIEYGKLNLLLGRNLLAAVIRMLMNIYTTQQVRVLWTQVILVVTLSQMV